MENRNLLNKSINLNGKEYKITTQYKDYNYGEIIKAVSTKLKDFERIYFIKNEDGKYQRVYDEKILKYIFESYEKIESDIIL